MGQTVQETATSSPTFRDYSLAKPHVVEFYRKNHEIQTLDFVLKKKAQYKDFHLAQMSVW